MSPLSPTSGGGANIHTAGAMGGLTPRAWGFGSRAALQLEMYYGMQTLAYIVAYADRFNTGLDIDADGRETYAAFSTALYGLMGMGATVLTLTGAVATGQWWYAGLAIAAIPLQIDTFTKNLNEIAKKRRIRKYYEKREEIIAAGLWG